MTDKKGFDVDEQPAMMTFAEIDAWTRTEKGIAWAAYASGCMSSAQPVAEPAKEVQPAVQFEEWWAKFRDSKDWEAEDISDQTIARAAWQAALASQSGGGK